MEEEHLYAYRALLAGALVKGTDEFHDAAEAAFRALEGRYPKLAGLASRVCGGRREAALWLVSECALLGARIPLQLLLTGQRSLVLYALSEIELSGGAHTVDP